MRGKTAAAYRLRLIDGLLDELGERCAGVVFHTGPRAFSLGDRIQALPISAIWAGR